MAIAADRRPPDCPGLAESRGRDRGDRMPMLIIDADAGSALLDDNRAAVSADRRHASCNQQGCMLIVSGIGSIVVVYINVRLGSVRTLIADVVAVRTDGRRAVGESATRRGDRARDARLAIEQEDRSVGVVGHELPVGAHHRAEMVTATRRNPGDWRRRHDERNCGRSNREYQRRRCIVGGHDSYDRTRGRCGIAGWLSRAFDGGALAGSVAAYRRIEVGAGSFRRGDRRAAGKLSRLLWVGIAPPAFAGSVRVRGDLLASILGAQYLLGGV